MMPKEGAQVPSVYDYASDIPPLPSAPRPAAPHSSASTNTATPPNTKGLLHRVPSEYDWRGGR